MFDKIGLEYIALFQTSVGDHATRREQRRAGLKNRNIRGILSVERPCSIPFLQPWRRGLRKQQNLSKDFDLFTFDAFEEKVGALLSKCDARAFDQILRNGEQQIAKRVLEQTCDFKCEHFSSKNRRRLYALAHHKNRGRNNGRMGKRTSQQTQPDRVSNEDVAGLSCRTLPVRTCRLSPHVASQENANGLRVQFKSIIRKLPVLKRIYHRWKTDF